MILVSRPVVFSVTGTPPAPNTGVCPPVSGRLRQQTGGWLDIRSSDRASAVVDKLSDTDTYTHTHTQAHTQR